MAHLESSFTNEVQHFEKNDSEQLHFINAQ
jgi:hypothetical protein